MKCKLFVHYSFIIRSLCVLIRASCKRSRPEEMWRFLGTTCGSLGSILGSLGAILGASRADLGPTWVPKRASNGAQDDPKTSPSLSFIDFRFDFGGAILARPGVQHGASSHVSGPKPSAQGQKPCPFTAPQYDKKCVRFTQGLDLS